MASSRLTVEITGSLFDPAKTFEAELASLLSNYGGIVATLRFTPTSTSLTELKLSKQLVAALVVAGIKTPADLAALTEKKLIAVHGVNWATYRRIVRQLHYTKGLRLASAAPFHQSLESLELSSSVYLLLRTCGQGQIRTIADLAQLDMITMSWLTNKSFASRLRSQLASTGHSFAPLAPQHTVKDLLGSYAAHLEKFDLPRTTRLSDLTRQRLMALNGPSATQQLNLLISELADLGIDLGGPLFEAEL